MPPWTGSVGRPPNEIQRLRRGDWQGLTADEFSAIKEQIKGRPYTELLWLCCYLDDTIAPAAEFAAHTTHEHPLTCHDDQR